MAKQIIIQTTLPQSSGGGSGGGLTPAEVQTLINNSIVNKTNTSGDNITSPTFIDNWISKLTPTQTATLSEKLETPTQEVITTPDYVDGSLFGNFNQNYASAFSDVVGTTNYPINANKFENIDLNQAKKTTLFTILPKYIANKTPFKFDFKKIFLAFGLESATYNSNLAGAWVLRNNLTNTPYDNFNNNYQATFLPSPRATGAGLNNNPPAGLPNGAFTTTGQRYINLNFARENFITLSSLVKSQYPTIVDENNNIMINDLSTNLNLFSRSFSFQGAVGSYSIDYIALTGEVALTTTWTSWYTTNDLVGHYLFLYTKDFVASQEIPLLISGDNSISIAKSGKVYDVKLPANTKTQIDSISSKTDIAQVNSAIATKQAEYTLWGKEYVNNGKYAFQLDSTNNWQSIYNKTVTNFFDEDLNETIISNNNISIWNKNIASLPTKIFETKIERVAVNQFVQGNTSNSFWYSYEIDRQGPSPSATLVDSFNAWNLYSRLKTLEATRVRTAFFINSSSNSAFRINTPTTANVPKIYNVTNLFFNNNPTPNYTINEGLVGSNGLLLYDNDNQKLIANPALTTNKKISLTIELIHNNPSLTAGDAYSLAIGLSSVENGTTDTALTIFDNGPIFKAETFISSLTLIPNKTYKETDDISFGIPATPTEESRLNGFKICLINRNNTPYDFNNMQIVINATLGE
jgi:hypothetical protein